MQKKVGNFVAYFFCKIEENYSFVLQVLIPKGT